MADRHRDHAVLFDVDGTLMDTVYLHTVTWWEALRQHDRDVPMAVVHRAIGMGSGRLLDHVLGADRDHGADPAIEAAHSTLYGQYWSRLPPLPGAVELLRESARRGWAVVLASSASEREFAVMRDALDADDVITTATHAADVESSKPAPDLVRRALERAAVGADRAVFVGDAVWDGQAAARAEVAFVGLESGGVSRAELSGAGAAQVFADPADLLARIDDSLLAAPRALSPGAPHA